LVATQESRERLIRMGELPERIFVTGAPGLDGLDMPNRASRAGVCAAHGLDPARRFALMVYHPVLQEAEQSGDVAAAILSGLDAARIQVLALMPNSDAGSVHVRRVLSERHGEGRIALATHLARADYVSALSQCDLMIGNSSSGIIEAATFGTPVVNVGVRQNLRQRNLNVLDVPDDAAAIRDAIPAALAAGRFPPGNVYGDGQTAERIATLLQSLPLDLSVFRKVNAY
jgi:GDP/UDP-N,N'-diacetylbacillosamine 2-epimerase (hydrolysing)